MTLFDNHRSSLKSAQRSSTSTRMRAESTPNVPPEVPVPPEQPPLPVPTEPIPGPVPTRPTPVPQPPKPVPPNTPEPNRPLRPTGAGVVRGER
jgi:protein TonB